MSRAEAIAIAELLEARAGRIPARLGRKAAAAIRAMADPDRAKRPVPIVPGFIVVDGDSWNHSTF
jgi:hypothetical protein